MKSKGKQIRISDSVFEEIQKLSEEYDLDKRSIMGAAIVLLRGLLTKGADGVDFVKNGIKIGDMPAPIVFKKKDEVAK